MAIVIDLDATSRLNTYTKLQEALINFSHRSDLASIIPDLIRLAEDKIYAVLDSNKQDLSTTLTTVADQNYVDLPTDTIKLRTAAIVTNSWASPLEYSAPDQLNNQYSNLLTGVPVAYTTYQNLMLLRPTPDDAYSINIVYEARLDYLSDSAPANWLLTNYPLIYVYASLEQIAMYINEEPSLYEAEWQRVADGINKRDWYDSPTMQVKTDVNLSRQR
jgi:hypothetical protein